MRWHINHVLACSDELLRNQIPKPPSRLDRPRAHLEVVRPATKPINLVRRGLHHEPIDLDFFVIDRDRCVGPLVWIDSNHHLCHDCLLLISQMGSRGGHP